MNRFLCNQRLRMFDDTNRPRVCVPIRSPGEGDAHYRRKLDLAERYKDNAWVCEAILKVNGRYRKLDFVVLDTPVVRVYEIVNHETFKSIKKKMDIGLPAGWALVFEYVGGGP